MPSYQDLETQVIVLEDKLDFVMKTFSVSKRYPSLLNPGQDVIETKSLLDLYREVKAAGAMLINPTKKEEVDGTASESTSTDESSL